MSQADTSQLSNKSFLTSLDDDELLELINRLSQRNRDRHEHNLLSKDDPNGEIQNEFQGSLSPIPPLSEPLIDRTDDSSVHDSTLSVPLAQLPVSDNSEEDEGKDDKENIDDEEDNNVIFGDYGKYFAAKGRNQQLEDEKYIEWERMRRKVQGLDDKKSSLFKDCVIYVNGYTKPSIATIHKLVILNGGKFIHYLSSKGAATHVVASRLTPRKQLEFKNYKVVKPEWITDSVAKGSIQRWHDYSLIRLDYGQVKLPFAQRKEAGSEEDEEDDSDGDGEGDGDDGQDLKQLARLQETTPRRPEDIGLAIDSKHPDFLRTFFAKSRLHHLSTWKADLRAEFLAKAMNQARSKHRTYNKSGFKLIMHIDFDCFFASASALNRPDLDFQNTPVCVSHGGSSASSTADVSSCNYVCRKFGIKNGTWVGNAKKLCPQLVCLDYDFPTYERISNEFYQILLDLEPDCILPVSIDEALVEITSFIDENNAIKEVSAFCEKLRNDIYSRTRCTVSLGVSSNVLLAKLSLRKAKPNGCFYLHDNISEFLHEISVRDLPGTGRSVEQKLVNELFPFSSERRPTVADVLTLDKRRLERMFGIKTGQKLYDYCRGIDNTSIDISENPQQFMRKSVSIDISWGIRFDEISQIDTFLLEVAKEIAAKLKKINVCAAQVTLKILKRAKYAPVDPPKYLGCGECDAFSKSAKLGVATDDYKIIGTEARAIFRHIGCDPKELRGVSIQVTKLSEKKEKETQRRLPFSNIDSEDLKKRKLEKKVDLEPDLSLDVNEQANISSYDIPTSLDSSILGQLPESIQTKIRQQRDRNLAPVSTIPKEVDLEVFNQLPRDIQEELEEELRRRNIQINPKTPNKNKKVYLQQVFGVNGEHQFVRVVSPRRSPSKRVLKSPVKEIEAQAQHVTVKWDDIDENVLNELPSYIRHDIVEEWREFEKVRKTEYEKMKEKAPMLKRGVNGDLHLDDFRAICKPLEFQRRNRPKEIMQLVDRWIETTRNKGPHKRDLEMFETYILSLHSRNKSFSLLLKRRMSVMLRITNACDKWQAAYDDLMNSIN